MTWLEFKQLMEKANVQDDTIITYIDIYSNVEESVEITFDKNNHVSVEN
jgi:hypothetical protein